MRKIGDSSLLSCYELVKRYISGNSDAFGVLYGRYYGFVRNTCRKIIQDKNILPDLVQTTFLNALRRIASFQPTSSDRSFKKWLWKIAFNASISHCRLISKDKKTTQKAFDEQIIHPPSKEPNPGKAVEKRERRCVLLRAVAKLPQLTRECVTAYYFHGVSYKEISKAFGLTKQKVADELYKGRRVLAVKLRKLI